MTKRSKSAIEWVTVCILVFVVQLWASALLLRDQLPGLYAVFVHLASVALLAVWVFRRTSGSRRRNLGLISLISVALLGPIGALGALVSACVILFSWGKESSFEKWYEQTVLDPLERLDRNADTLEKFSRSTVRAASSRAKSFHDVLDHGDYESKQKILAHVGSRYRAEYASIVRRALADSDPSMRVRAATVMEKIDSSFARELVKREAARRLSPNDADAIERVALHLDNYANAGLWSDERTLELRLKAAESFEAAYAVSKGESRIRKNLVRVLIRVRNYSKVLELCDAISLKDMDYSELTWYAEALFALGAYERLRLVGDRMKATESHSLFPSRAKNMVAQWGRSDKDVAA